MTTVDQLRPSLIKYAGPTGTVTDAAFLDLLNQVRERFINSGKWKNMIVERTVVPVSGTFTLPQDCESLIGVQVDGFPVTVLGSTHEFVPGGVGELTPGEGAAAAVIDQGDRTFKVMGIPEAAEIRILGKLRYVEIVPEPTPTANIVVSGSGVTSVDGTYIYVGTYNGHRFYVNALTPLLTIFYTSSWVLSGNPPNPAPMVTYYSSPDDVVTPDAATTWTPSSGAAANPTIVAETVAGYSQDVVPSNFGALKMGLMALKFEDENDLERAEAYWQKGLSLLNDETREARGATQQIIRQSVFSNPGRGIHNII